MSSLHAHLRRRQYDISSLLSPLSPESELESSSLSMLVLAGWAGSGRWVFFFFGAGELAGVDLGTLAVSTHEERVRK